MEWHPIDFQSIVTIDRSLIEHLNRYLDERESLLAISLMEAIHVPFKEIPVLAPPHPQTRLTLGESLELFRKNKQSSQESLMGEHTIEQINEALWDYVEVLEGSVTELFQQVSQLGFKAWKPDLIWVLDSLKEILRQRIESLRSVISRLEDLLGNFNKQRSFFSFLKGKIGRLDKALLVHLDRSHEFLMEEYQKFMNRYNGYHTLNNKSQELLAKFDGYLALQRLESTSQEKFKEIYRQLRMCEINKQIKAVPQEEMVGYLRSLVSVEQASSIFRNYLQALDEILFQTSRIVKLGFQEGTKTIESIQEEITQYRLELHTLGVTMTRYRDFILKSDPNPYISKRWGFTEWIVGPEPVKSKNLLYLGYQVESLDSLYLQFSEELKDSVSEEALISSGQKIQQLLHEVSQPLVSHFSTVKLTGQLISFLEELHELGSTHLSVVGLIGDSLARGMRGDWKYQTLQENKKFHQVYNLHKRIIGLHGDRFHANRMHKFKQHFQRIESWIKVGEIASHTQEVETEINDIKFYLQDFLASLQRLEKVQVLSDDHLNRSINEIQFQLLEYRYLFSKFFYHLLAHPLEGKQMRKRFLFVDQYFEYIESRLNILKTTQKIPKAS